MKKENILTNKSKLTTILISGIMLLAVAFGLLFSGNMLTASAATDDDYWNKTTPYDSADRSELSDIKFTIALSETEGYIRVSRSHLISLIGIDNFGGFRICVTLPNGTHSFIGDDDWDSYFENGVNSSFGKSYGKRDAQYLEFDIRPFLSSYGVYKVYLVFEGNTRKVGDDKISTIYLSNILDYYYNCVALPDDPVKTGYDFVGWYYDAAFTMPYQGAAITIDTNLYAKFTPISYTITYNLNGGTLTSAWTDYNIESTKYTLPSPTRNYYIFDGWYTNASFTGSPVTVIDTGSIGDKSFYAKFTPITYAITYELNGGTMTGQTTSYNVTSAVINLPTAYKNGYTFGGWYTSATFSGSAVTTIPTGSNGDKIYYAKYTPLEYSITYYLNGGTLTGQQVTYNIESATYTLPTPTMTGYIFKGWFADSSLTGSAVSSISQGSTGNKVLYAKWELITYTVTFYVNGTVYKQLTVGYGSVLDGYYFADGNMQSVSFFADPALTATYNLGYEIYGDTIIFASTDFDLYVSLTYSVNGIEMSTDLLEYNAILSNLRTYEVEGYNFGGWYYDKTFTKPVSDMDKLTSNITIYAKLTETETPTFWQKVGSWFGSYGWIVIVGAVAVIVLGGVGYAISRKKKA